MARDESRPIITPRIAGALGSFDQKTITQLRRSLPAGARAIISTKTTEFYATLPVVESSPGQFSWNALAPGTKAPTWRSASQDRLAAGLVAMPDSGLLHSCAWGLQELYYRKLGNAVYFCDRIDPLVALGSAPLHIDWDAWGTILTFGGPQGEDTPFQEVRRVGAATAIEVGPRGLLQHTYTPSWLDVEPQDHAVSPEAFVDLLTAHMPVTRLWGAKVDITLSGGWDSRLLAATATRTPGRGRIHAWTTSTDDGVDDDVRFSAPVAHALGLKHHVMVPGREAWLEHRSTLLERVQFQTWLHTWLLPLANRMRGRTGPLLDGLAGDVLLKNLFIDEEMLEAPRQRQAVALLAKKLVAGRGTRPKIYAPKANAWLTETAQATYNSATSANAGHPQELPLRVLAARTTRTIAASPLLLFGPERTTLLPFLAPDVAAASLAVPLAAKAGGAFYRQLLAAAASDRIANLPSTNDVRQIRAPGQRRQATMAAVAATARSILADDVATSLLDPAVVQGLADTKQHEEFARWGGQLGAAQSVAMFADWRRKYRSRLDDSALPY